MTFAKSVHKGNSRLAAMEEALTFALLEEKAKCTLIVNLPRQKTAFWWLRKISMVISIGLIVGAIGTYLGAWISLYLL